jgi:iron only hydrogenase large subunit-like protein
LGVDVYRSLRIFEQECIGCMTCMRSCTARAIRMRREKPVVLEDRCIDCGECIRVCAQKAIRPKTPPFFDLARFEYLIAVPCAPLLVQFQQDVGPNDVLAALHRLGFDEAVTTGMDRACEAYMMALAKLILTRKHDAPFITSHCPAILRVVQTIYPDLIEHLVPLVSPRELAARWAKEEAARRTGLPIDKVGVVYITPCPSKVVDIQAHRGEGNSNVDVLIPVNEIYPEILTALGAMRRKGELTRKGDRASALAWAILGGMSRNLRRIVYALDRRLPRRGRRSADMIDFLPVAQISSVRRLFEEMEKGRLHNVDLIECMACPEGCVGGSLTVDNPYVARSKTISLLRSLPPPEEAMDWTRASADVRSGVLEARDAFVAAPPAPLDPDMGRSIQKMMRKEELVQLLPGIDCGACGSPTCEELAFDIIKDLANLSDCLVLKARGQSPG